MGLSLCPWLRGREDRIGLFGFDGLPEIGVNKLGYIISYRYEIQDSSGSFHVFVVPCGVAEDGV
jgi:hypothetical protein